MNVVIEDAGTCRKKIKIECPADKVQADYQNVLNDFCKIAQIKGFRPGKAPVKVVEKRYSKEITKEVRERMIPAGYQQAIKEENLKVLQVLNIEEPEIKPGEPSTFSVTVEIAPQFELPEYRNIPLTKEIESVSDEKINEVITHLQQQFASFEEVEGRPVQKGDLVKVDYNGTCEGQPIETISPESKGLGTREDFWLRTDENVFLPGFEDGVEGAQVGETRQVPITFPDHFAATALQGKQANYEVVIKGIREKRLPEMDEKFLERIGVKSEEELRTHIRGDLERQAEQRANEKLRNEVVEHVLNQVETDLPPTSVEQETSQIVQDIIRQNSTRGTDQAHLIEKKDEILQTAGKNAQDRVKAQLVLDVIAEKEDIKVSDDQMREHLTRMAMTYGMKPDGLRAELEKRNAMDRVEAELRRSQVIDLLVQQASIAETTAS